MNTWVLLRGLTRERRHWGDFPAQLREGLGSAQVITLDLPGNGRLHRQRSLGTIEANAAFCRAELQRLGVPPPYHLLAMSLGAMVAVDWAQRYPHELAAGVLINTSLRQFSPFYQRLRPGSYLPLLRTLLISDVRRREHTVLALTSNRTPVPLPLLDDWIAWYRECPVSRTNALRQLMAALNFRAGAAAPSVPMLVLCGAGDRLVDPRCSHTLAQEWGCTHAEHPGAGHDLALDEAAWVVQQVTRWLAEQPSAIGAPPISEPPAAPARP